MASKVILAAIPDVVIVAPGICPLDAAAGFFSDKFKIISALPVTYGMLRRYPY